MASAMRAVEEALRTKKPLPQFLPSARIAHLRVINRVRAVLIDSPQLETVISASDRATFDLDEDEYKRIQGSAVNRPSKCRHKMLLKRYMGWSATSSALEEVIEYQEELVDLAKLLVGYNEFRYGFLSRPLYNSWAELPTKQFNERIAKRHESVGQGMHSTSSYSSMASSGGELDLATGLSTRTADAYSHPNEADQADYNPQYISQGVAAMAPLERRVTLEFPKVFRKRKNSLIIIPASPSEGIAQPHLATSTSYRPAIPPSLPSLSQHLMESEELPVSLKRVVSRRRSIQNNI